MAWSSRRRLCCSTACAARAATVTWGATVRGMPWGQAVLRWYSPYVPYAGPGAYASAQAVTHVSSEPDAADELNRIGWKFSECACCTLGPMPPRGSKPRHFHSRDPSSGSSGAARACMARGGDADGDLRTCAEEEIQSGKVNTIALHRAKCAAAPFAKVVY